MKPHNKQQGTQRMSLFTRVRAQSEIIGTAMIIGVILTASIGAFALSTTTLNQYQSHARTLSSQDALSQLDSHATQVALGTTHNNAIVDLGASQFGTTRVQNTGHIKIALVSENATIPQAGHGGHTRYHRVSSQRTVLVNQTMGTVNYVNSRSGAQVAYQGGGVWKSPGGTTQNQSVMVAPPPFHWTQNTLSFPLISIDAHNSSGGSHRLKLSKENGSTVYPTNQMQNPVSRQKLVVTITSRFYQAWGRFFKNRVGASVSYSGTNNQVTAILTQPYHSPRLTNALIESSGVASVHMGGSSGMVTDSYNSSVKPYQLQHSSHGGILAHGNVSIHGQGTIKGSVTSGNGVHLGRNGRVTGNVSYTASPAPSQSQVGGWINSNASVSATQPVTQIIQNRVASAQTSNNNGQTNAIQNNALQSGTVTAGTYYVSNGALNGGNVKFDTTNGNITLVINGNVDWSGATLKTTTPNLGRVKVFTTGNIQIQNSNVGDVNTQRAPAFRLYGEANSTTSISQGSTFVGLLYAPSYPVQHTNSHHHQPHGRARGHNPGGPHGQHATVQIRGSQTDVYGSVVAGGSSASIRNGATIHYDKALTTTTPLSGTKLPPGKSYLHILRRTITVTKH